MLINQQHIYTLLKKLRTFFQGLDDSQRYNMKDLVRVERKRALKATISSITVSIKYIIVVMLRNTFAIVFLFKLVIIAVLYTHSYDISITCFYCNKSGYIKFDCFDLNKFLVVRICEIVDEFNDEMKKVLEFVDKMKKV